MKHTKLDDLGIKEVNFAAHEDIQKDIDKKQNGVFSFVIRVNNGEIVDYLEQESSQYSLTISYERKSKRTT